MHIGDQIIVNSFSNDYYRATGKVTKIYTKVINTYPEPMVLIHFEPREILKVGMPLSINPVEFLRSEVSRVTDASSLSSSRFGVGAKVRVCSPDRIRTNGMEGIVISEDDGMVSVRFQDGTDLWFTSSEITESEVGDAW